MQKSNILWSVTQRRSPLLLSAAASLGAVATLLLSPVVRATPLHPPSHLSSICSPGGGGTTPTPTPTPSQSTGWHIEVQGKGTNGSSHPPAVVTEDGSTPWNFTRWTESGDFEVGPSSGSSASAPPHETANASTTGSFKVVCTWQGDPAQEPDHITLAVSTSGYVYIPHPNSGTDVPPHMSVSITDGWGKTYDIDLHSKTWNPSSTHLLKKETKGQQVVTFQVDGVSAQGTYGPDSDDDTAGHIVNVGAGATAKEDNRSVILKRGGRYEHWQLEGGEWHTYDDSIYSAHDENYALQPNWNLNDYFAKPNQLQINAEYPGGKSLWTSITPTWSPSGFFSLSTQDEDKCSGVTLYGNIVIHNSAPEGNVEEYSYKGSFTGHQTFTTKYTASDADGANATAYYHLTLHDPIELASSDLTDDPTVTNYTIEKVFFGVDGNPVIADGPRDPNDESKVTTSESVESGIELKATADVSLFKDILGLSAETTYTSKYTITQEDNVTKPSLPEGTYEYLIAQHIFARYHLRFYLYDTLGEIRRTIGSDANGNSLNPPLHVYHELIYDKGVDKKFRWSTPLHGTVDPQAIAAIPPTPAPDPVYDYPSGGAS